MSATNNRRPPRRNNEPCNPAGDNGYVHVFVKPLEGGSSNVVLSLLGVTRLEVPSTHLLSTVCALALVGIGVLLARLTTLLFSLLSAYYFLALCCRRTLTSGRLYLLFCAGVTADVLATQWGSDGALAFLLYAISVSLAAAAAGLGCRVATAVAAFFVAVRVVTLTSLGEVPSCVRPLLAHACGFCGVLAAKYTESSLRPPITTIITQDGKILAVRRRRTSSSSGLHVGVQQKTNARRTSLPALSSGHRSHQSSSSTVDVALLAEAHGLVTDMLADPTLPPHVVSGLRALASLLSTPNHASSHGRPRPGGASVGVALADFNSGSDTEEIPYTGERPSALPKRLRRNLPPSLLRRMSTSTWTTTTSATGMPTLEPEPIRKRSTSFRNNAADQTSVSPGSGGATPAVLSNRSTSPNNVLQSLGDIPSKGRSYSTTSIPTASVNRKVVRERKTVCSLHPLTSADLEALHAAHDNAQQLTSSGTTEEEEELPPPAEPPDPLPPLPSIRRLNITSDYESSNESPSGSDSNDAVTEGLRGPKSLGVQTTGDFPRCSLCGARTRQSLKEGASGRNSVCALEQRSPTPAEPLDQGQISTAVDVVSDSTTYFADGISYNIEQLASDPLLSRINEWDYPIFELNEKSSNLILSQMCYQVFLEVGLFDTFRIPLQEFFNYFHALENGYREKPYHNRMHAADVLHGVYYLTSQPIPGFAQMPVDSTDSPLHKTTLVHRQSFVAEDTYGIMGANFPALELMALYTAAAMHDYDHPGRTNAFLVSTYAPQAVLYNDRSVLENHHAAAAWSLFLSDPRYNWLCHMEKAEFKRFRFLVIECILATDLKQHFEILAEFNAKANDEDAHGIDWLQETDRLLVTQMCIKLADINGPCKKHSIHVQWTYRIAEEFYEQGDEEEALGLQISPFMDRRYPQLAKLQESFINHLVAPLCNAYGESGLLPGHWIDSPDSEDDGVAETDQPEVSDFKDTEDELVDSDQGGSHPVDATVHRRPSRQLRPQKVVCLQTKHLQENYEHWIGILKEESRSKEDQEQEDNSVEDEDDEAASQGEMETIHEEDSSSPKSTPPRDGC